MQFVANFTIKNNSTKENLQQTRLDAYAARHVAEKFAIANPSLAATITSLAGLGEQEGRL